MEEIEKVKAEIESMKEIIGFIKAKLVELEEVLKTEGGE